MRNKRKIFFYLGLFIILLVATAEHQSLLIMAGEFFAPEKMEEAEAVVIESSELVREKAVVIGQRLISTRRANLLVVVYQDSPEEKIFDRPENYNGFITRKLENMGLKKDQFLILKVPKEHPITLTEAKIVLNTLAQKQVKRIILLTESFHTRRSFWSYKNVGAESGIKIFPVPYFLKYQKDNWWQHNQGIREFCAESVKYLYYLFRGYIPWRSLVTI